MSVRMLKKYCHEVFWSQKSKLSILEQFFKAVDTINRDQTLISFQLLMGGMHHLRVIMLEKGMAFWHSVLYPI